MRNPFRKHVKTTQANQPSLEERFPDTDPDMLRIVDKVQPFTMTSPERLIALCDSVRHVVKHDLQGDFVECGVWRGGSMMAIAATLLQLGCDDRQLWLYDTFQGMSAPTNVDIDLNGRDAGGLLAEQDKADESSIWCFSSLNEVKANLKSIGYPQENIRYQVGAVEETIPQRIPESISLLRLDTDWYESTRHELEHLFPVLCEGGVLIIDDYGHWAGCRRAVDEYFKNHALPIMLCRIDYTGRVAIKPPHGHRQQDLNHRNRAG